MSDPVVLVLAGGASNRFWPLEDKPFFPFAGTCLMERHLRMLRDLGCQRFVVVSRPDTQTRVNELGATLAIEQLHVVPQDEAAGMADAVLKAAAVLEDLGDCPIYITQAQDVVDPDLHRAMLSRTSSDAFATIAASRVGEYFPGGYLSLVDGRVTSIVEKPGAGNEPSDLVNIVAHTFQSWRPLLQKLDIESRTGSGDDSYERVLASLMKERVFHAAIYEGRWEALKFPWQVLNVLEMLLERWSSGQESPGEGYEVEEDGVIRGRDVRVFPGAHVVAPALLGHGVVIGHNVLVRSSLIGPASVVGFGSEVARSYLGEGVELHHNYVGDSVLGDNTSMGFGGTTANFRLDGRTVPSMVSGQRIDTGREKFGTVMGNGAKIGVNTSLMPGIKVGPGAMIGPNLRINRDVPAGERVLYDDEYGRL